MIIYIYIYIPQLNIFNFKILQITLNINLAIFVLMHKSLTKISIFLFLVETVVDLLKVSFALLNIQQIDFS